MEAYQCPECGHIGDVGDFGEYMDADFDAEPIPDYVTCPECGVGFIPD
jgi:rubredoxin